MAAAVVAGAGKAAERLEDARPFEGRHAARRRPRARASSASASSSSALERRDPARHVAEVDGASGASAHDEVAERVAACRHDRESGPEAVEQPGAEGEARLEVVEVRRDAEVGLEQVARRARRTAPSRR